MKRKIYPPHWMLILLGVELALWRWLPIARWHFPGEYLAGGAVIALGVGLGGWAALLFKRKKTGIIPFSESTALAVEGPYRFTRNPMYLGMTLLLAGVALALGAVSPFVAPPLFVAVITSRFILPEEAHMERAFGDSYLDLKRRVRRWL